MMNPAPDAMIVATIPVDDVNVYVGNGKWLKYATGCKASDIIFSIDGYKDRITSLKDRANNVEYVGKITMPPGRFIIVPEPVDNPPVHPGCIKTWGRCIIS
jgi:hypothetical protein